MSWHLKNPTLVIISVICATALPIAGSIAAPVAFAIGDVVDHFWGGLDPETIWLGIDATANVYVVLVPSIIIASLVCGALALYGLYRRYKAGTASKRLFMYPAVLCGFSIFLALIGYIYLPLTATW